MKYFISMLEEKCRLWKGKWSSLFIIIDITTKQKFFEFRACRYRSSFKGKGESEREKLVLLCGNISAVGPQREQAGRVAGRGQGVSSRKEVSGRRTIQIHPPVLCPAPELCPFIWTSLYLALFYYILPFYSRFCEQKHHLWQDTIAQKTVIFPPCNLRQISVQVTEEQIETSFSPPHN